MKKGEEGLRRREKGEEDQKGGTMNLGDPVVTSRSKILQGPVSLLQYIFRFLLAIAWGMILGCTPLCLSLSYMDKS